MAKKKEKTPRLKSYWHDEGITDPYQVIAEFFSAEHLYDSRKYLTRLIDTAYSHKVWKGNNPDYVLFQFDMLESLFNAAWLIDRERETSSIVFNRSDDFNPNLFSSSETSHNAWDEMPRSLSYREYQDPYRVFRKIFRRHSLDKWLYELREITRMALRKDCYTEVSAFPSHHILHNLLRLVEAAHLIDVREITHVGGIIKSRISRKATWA
jgi:hypothetical protein